MIEKIRTIVTQDAEVDDQNSLRHLLLYANEIEIQGIIQTSSKFHWKGEAGIPSPADSKGEYDKPYRWPGTDWMFKVIDDYSVVYPNLSIQSTGYPSPDELRQIVKIGNIGYPGEMDASTDGSKLIETRILDTDPRKLYIQVWGGTNTIARALKDIEAKYSDKSDWTKLKEKIENKVVITACGEQDETYSEYIAEQWPNIQFICCLQMKSYAYAWSAMPDGESKQTLSAQFMKKNILTGNGPLLEGYSTWADGHHYEGEPEKHQFGSNYELLNNWWGMKYGLGTYHKYDFLSEGDSPTFLILLPNGLRNLDDVSLGGIAGRYKLADDKFNSKGQPLNYWNPEEDEYEASDGSVVKTESMWRYVADIQHDMAARAKWCVSSTYNDSYHAPEITVKDEQDISAKPNDECEFKITTNSSESSDILLDTQTYSDISDFNPKFDINKTSENTYSVKVSIPDSVNSGDIAHLIIRATSTNEIPLVSYKRLSITVKN